MNETYKYQASTVVITVENSKWNNRVKMVPTLLLPICLSILLIATGASVIPSREEKSKVCGYESCPEADPEKINIHLVPHTHDDVGWLKTVDQYYYGVRNTIQRVAVQYILNSVIKSLQESPDRRFIYVESAFFFKWWDKQNDKMQEVVKSLINEGRLEIIGGAWSMNDEAVTHYQSIIDQFSWGFRRLNDTFGKCARPKIGWQIDPFGHSREQASMFAQMGFDGLLFARLDYQDRLKRLNEKTAELIWKGSPNLGKSSNLFTSILYNAYSSPDGFCFDVQCTDEPLIDDPESPEFNIYSRVEAFLAFVNKQSGFYRTNNVIITMGNDFTYHNADTWYTNLDKLIKHINTRNGTNYHAFYSTPSCYLKAVNNHNLKWTSKDDDFFPYGSDPHAYWTGYYTSRPALKFFERMGNNFLQVTKQLSVLTNQPESRELGKLREAMGILQHHDAITGTEKQEVAWYYARILYDSMKASMRSIRKALRKIIVKEEYQKEDDSIKFGTCLQLNISSCELTENHRKFVVTVYNPTSQPLSTYVRLPVTKTSYEVRNYLGRKHVTQIIPIPAPVRNIPGRKSEALYELVFDTLGISPFGYQSFFISENERQTEIEGDGLNEIDKDYYTRKYDITVNESGSVTVRSINNKSIAVTQSFHYYTGAEGDNREFKNRSSGAYVFRPNGTIGMQNFTYTRGNIDVFQGPLVQEVHLTVNERISEVIRTYNRDHRIEFHWLVGPIDIQDKKGKEVITRYTTDIQSQGEFYTDSNGREMMKRTRNKRRTWSLLSEEPISGNYYPVTSKISLKEKEKNLKLSVLTDRAQGGTSLNDGQIELMLHRRLLFDDQFGVNEPLNETAFGEGLVIKGQHSVYVGEDSNSSTFREKYEAIKLSLRPWVFITPVEETTGFEDYRKKYWMNSNGLAIELPPNVRILTLEPWRDGSVLLRLEHFFELGESETYSKPAEINIRNLFSAFTVTSVDETTLGGNEWIEEYERLKWTLEEDKSGETDYSSTTMRSNKDTDDIIVVLKPMQIRTFIVNISPVQ